MAGISILVFGLIEAPTHGWTDPLVLTAFASGVVLLVGFVVRQLRTDHPLLDMSLFRDLHFSIAAAAIAFAFFTLFGMIFMLTQYLQLVHGLSALQAGLMMLPLVVGLPLGAAISVRLGARVRGPRDHRWRLDRPRRLCSPRCRCGSPRPSCGSWH